MELIVEVLFEFIVEGCFKASSSKRLPKWVRFLLLSIIFVPLILLFFYISLNSNITFSVLCVLIGSAFFVAWIFLLVKVRRNEK